jgi:hypothetical protein
MAAPFRNVLSGYTYAVKYTSMCELHKAILSIVYSSVFTVRYVHTSECGSVYNGLPRYWDNLSGGTIICVFLPLLGE